MSEQWEYIKGLDEDYMVSDKGGVKSLKYGKERILKGYITQGYRRVELSMDGASKKYRVCRLVGIHFVPNPHNKPCINHGNGNTLDDSKGNLEWCTHSENTQHAIDTGLLDPISNLPEEALKGEKSPNSKLTKTDILDIRIAYELGWVSYTDLAKAYNVSKTCISHIIKEKTWNHI